MDVNDPGSNMSLFILRHQIRKDPSCARHVLYQTDVASFKSPGSLKWIISQISKHYS